MPGKRLDESFSAETLQKSLTGQPGAKIDSEFIQSVAVDPNAGGQLVPKPPPSPPSSTNGSTSGDGN